MVPLLTKGVVPLLVKEAACPLAKGTTEDGPGKWLGLRMPSLSSLVGVSTPAVLGGLSEPAPLVAMPLGCFILQLRMACLCIWISG